MVARTSARLLCSALFLALALPLGCSGSSEHTALPKPPDPVMPSKPVVVMSASASAAASVAAAPSVPASMQQCELAPALRAKVKPLLDEGRLNRALRVIDKADRLCTASASESWAERVVTLAEVGRYAEARALAETINASKQASPEAKVAAQRASILCSVMDVPDLQTNREARNEAKGLYAEAVVLQGKSDKDAQRKASEKFIEAWQMWHPNAQALVMAGMAAKNAGQDVEAQRLFDRAIVEAEKTYGKETVLEMADGRVGTSFDWSADGRQIATKNGKEVSIFDSSWVERFRLSVDGADITYFTYAPDEHILVTVSDDDIVRLWDTTWGTVIHKLVGHTDAIGHVLFSNDGKTLVSWSSDETARFWDIASGKEIRKIDMGGEGVALSPDEKTLVVESKSGLRFLEIASGTEIRKLPSVNRFEYSPDGKTFATLSKDQKELVHHDAVSGKPIHTFEVDPSSSSVFFSYVQGGKGLLAAASFSWQLWDVTSGKRIRNKYLSPGIVPNNGSAVGIPIVSGFSISRNGKKLVVLSGTDNTGGIFDIASGRETHKLIANDGVQWAYFGPDEKTIVTESENGVVTLWDGASGKVQRTFEKHVQPIESMAYSPDGKSFATGSADQTVRLWDLAESKGVRKIGKHNDLIFTVAYSPDGKSVASGARDGSVQIWDAALGKGIRKFKELDAIVKAVAYSPDGKWLATASYDSRVRIWDIATGKVFHTLEAESSSQVNAVAFSPDGKTLASVDGRTILLWDVASAKQYGKLTGHKREIESLSFSPDGKMLVSGAKDDTVRLWDLGSGKEIRKIAATWRVGHAKLLPFSPDGKLLAFPSDDKTVQLWDIATGTALRSFVGDDAAVRSMAFSPNGKFVAAVNDNATMLYRVEDGQWLGTFKAIATLDAGYVTGSAGYVDLLGPDACAARKLAVCHVGPMVFPIEACEERFLVQGLQAKLLAGDTSYTEPEITSPRMVCPKGR